MPELPTQDELRDDPVLRLTYATDMMRELSIATDPQAAVAAYASRIGRLFRVHGAVAISRRDLPAPKYRITRSSAFEEDINPWKQRDRLPVYDSGLLGKLIYDGKPVIIDDFHADPADPAYEHLKLARSLAAIPQFDRGVAQNMVVQWTRDPFGIDHDKFPEQLMMTALFGRATHNLVLSRELLAAYKSLDRELQVVADIQRALLPAALPKIPTLDIAVHYQTSRHAGGDYYDFFPLPDGRWGILIADVAGHGTPAAVVMAVMHSIAHTLATPPEPPAQIMSFINRHVSARYTLNGSFITAFYGIYDPRDRSIRYTSAGHTPPMVKRCSDGSVFDLDQANSLPLGIDPDETYTEASASFMVGDQIVLYTDGITEARGESHELFGTERLDRVLSLCPPSSDALLRSILSAVEEFTGGTSPTDDRTIVIARVTND